MLDSARRIAPNRRFLTEEDMQTLAEDEMESPLQVDDEDLKAWVSFLEHCGGFEVW